MYGYTRASQLCVVGRPRRRRWRTAPQPPGTEPQAQRAGSPGSAEPLTGTGDLDRPLRGPSIAFDPEVAVSHRVLTDARVATHPGMVRLVVAARTTSVGSVGLPVLGIEAPAAARAMALLAVAVTVQVDRPEMATPTPQHTVVTHISPSLIRTGSCCPVTRVPPEGARRTGLRSSTARTWATHRNAPPADRPLCPVRVPVSAGVRGPRLVATLIHLRHGRRTPSRTYASPDVVGCYEAGPAGGSAEGPGHQSHLRECL